MIGKASFARIIRYTITAKRNLDPVAAVVNIKHTAKRNKYIGLMFMP